MRWTKHDDNNCVSTPLDEQHELIITRTAEGIVLDVWKNEQDDAGPIQSRTLTVEELTDPNPDI